MVGRGKYQGAGRGSCASEQWGKRGEKTRMKDSTGSERPTPAEGSRSQPPAGAKGEPVPGRHLCLRPSRGRYRHRGGGRAVRPPQPRADQPGLPASGALSDPHVWT